MTRGRRAPRTPDVRCCCLLSHTPGTTSTTNLHRRSTTTTYTADQPVLHKHRRPTHNHHHRPPDRNRPPIPNTLRPLATCRPTWPRTSPTFRHSRFHRGKRYRSPPSPDPRPRPPTYTGSPASNLAAFHTFRQHLTSRARGTRAPRRHRISKSVRALRFEPEFREDLAHDLPVIEVDRTIRENLIILVALAGHEDAVAFSA